MLSSLFLMFFSRTTEVVRFSFFVGVLKVVMARLGGTNKSLRQLMLQKVPQGEGGGWWSVHTACCYATCSVALSRTSSGQSFCCPKHFEFQLPALFDSYSRRTLCAAYLSYRQCVEYQCFKGYLLEVDRDVPWPSTRTSALSPGFDRGAPP